MLPAKAVGLKPIGYLRHVQYRVGHVEEQKSTVFKNGVSGLLDLRRRKQQEDRGNCIVTNPAVCAITSAIR